MPLATAFPCWPAVALGVVWAAAVSIGLDAFVWSGFELPWR